MSEISTNFDTIVARFFERNPKINVLYEHFRAAGQVIESYSQHKILSRSEWENQASTMLVSRAYIFLDIALVCVLLSIPLHLFSYFFDFEWTSSFLLGIILGIYSRYIVKSLFLVFCMLFKEHNLLSSRLIAIRFDLIVGRKETIFIDKETGLLVYDDIHNIKSSTEDADIESGNKSAVFDPTIVLEQGVSCLIGEEDFVSEENRNC